MFIIGIFGILLLIWWGIVWTWKMIPYLFVIWVFVMVLGFVLDNWIILLLIGGLLLLAYGIYLEIKKVKSGKRL